MKLWRAREWPKRSAENGAYLEGSSNHVTASQSADGTQLTINGSGFGAAPPQVSLAGTRLSVIAASNTSITAALPAGTVPGAYLLIVTNGATHLLGVLTAAIGPVLLLAGRLQHRQRSLTKKSFEAPKGPPRRAFLVDPFGI